MTKLEDEGGFWTPLERFESEEGSVIGSSILYRMTASDYSHLHRLKEDELWVLVKGSVTQLLLYPDGTWEKLELCQSRPASMVRKHVWQAAWTEDEAIVACVLCPPFSELEMAGEEIASQYPGCPYIRKALK